MANAADTAYLNDAARWEEDIYRNSARDAQRWRLMAVLLGVLTIALGLGFAALLPLKEFRPYVITVDPQTGRTTASLIAQSGPLTQEEAVLKSLIGQYVIQRETYDLYDAKTRYENVAEMSAGSALVSYQKLWQRSNPEYPFKRFGQDSKLLVAITAISFLASDTASVQYTTTQVTQTGQHLPAKDHVAIVAFDFGRRKTALAGIIRNPFGFIVTSWRSDEVFKGE